MKKNTKWIIVTLVLVFVVGGAYILYDKLSDKIPDVGIIGSDDGPITVITPDETTEKKPEETTENSQAVTEENVTKSNYSPAPDFTVVDENGKEVKLSDYRGKPVVINFWTTWCYYCKEEMPDFNEAFKENTDIQFLMINVTDNVSETIEGGKKFKEDGGYDFPIFFDTTSQASFAYGVTGFPSTYFIDKNGNLVSKQIGMISADLLKEKLSMITE